MLRPLCLASLGFLLLATLGCSHASVECTAMVNDAKIPTGILTFNPIDDIEAPSVTAQVKDGVVTLVDNVNVSPGKTTVILMTSRKWLDPDSVPVQTPTEGQPDQSAVTLTVDFDVPEGPFELNFEYPQPKSPSN